MITEDYCSFEVAKLLKDKGFDVPCNHYYFDKELNEVNFYERNSDEHYLKEVEYCSAPTHQMAMKYVRKQGYHIVIFTDSPKYEVRIQDLNDGSFNIAYLTNTYDTYEEAVEAALKYYLTEICQIKKIRL